MEEQKVESTPAPVEPAQINTGPKIDIRSIDQLQAEVEKMLLMDDKDILRVLAAIAIAQNLRLDPIWLLLTAGSGGGKTELVSMLMKLPRVFTIDSLTTNTFASSMKLQGKEASLLNRIGTSGLIIFKEFTTILEMNEVSRKEIMSQLRAIFDGKYDKLSGNGEETNWHGKISVIACATTTIYHHMSKFSTMGERFIIYEILAPDRKAVGNKVFQRKLSSEDPNVLRQHLQDAFTSYIRNVRTQMVKNAFKLPPISNALQQEIILLADFCTRARSGIERDQYTRNIVFIPTIEAPTRMIEQFYSLLVAFVSLDKAEYDMRNSGQDTSTYDGVLTDRDRDVIIKIGLNSIPRKRREALCALAQYTYGVTAAGLATSLHYETDVMKEILAELDALKLCHRRKFAHTYRFVINDAWRDLILRIEHLSTKNEALESSDGSEDSSEHMQELDQIFDSNATGEDILKQF